MISTGGGSLALRKLAGPRNILHGEVFSVVDRDSGVAEHERHMATDAVGSVSPRRVQSIQAVRVDRFVQMWQGTGGTVLELTYCFYHSYADRIARADFVFHTSFALLKAGKLPYFHFT